MLDGFCRTKRYTLHTLGIGNMIWPALYLRLDKVKKASSLGTKNIEFWFSFGGEVYRGFKLFSFCLSVAPFSFFAKPFQKVLYASYHPEITIHSHPKYSLQCKIHVRWCYCCSLRLMSFNFFGFPQNVLFYFFDPFSVSLSLCSSLLGESCWQKLGANLLGKLVSILGQNRPAVALLG